MFLIFSAFALSLTASLLLTPLARMLGHRLGALDVPDARKVHSTPTPRTGGLAIFAATALAVAVMGSLAAGFEGGDAAGGRLAHVLGGAMLCFAVGLADDFCSLSARFKLLVQILAASLAFAGGVHIGMGAFADLGVLGAWVSYGVTVFWFLLFINAVNLIDGLDGLAGGVSFFAALVMVLVSVLGGNLVLAVLFAVLAGSILGFLRYNHNPATIFLGDGGSYFIGFAIAGLSILGNLKEQTGVAFLIPMIAMGLPLFDTAVSSVRRFVRGRNVFGADRRHVHHRLLDMGLTAHRAVMLLYMVTLVLCAVALVLVNLKDGSAGMVLVALFVCAVIFSRELGYFRDLHVGHVRRWLADVLHATGASRQRRMLLDAQLGIARARTGTELWMHVIEALELMEFDHAQLYLDQVHRVAAGATPVPSTVIGGGLHGVASQPAFEWDNPAAVLASVVAGEDNPAVAITDPDAPAAEAGQWFYRIELPLACEKCGRVFGTLVLAKDHGLGAISQFTLPRVEHLRRAVMHALDGMAGDSGDSECGLQLAPPAVLRGRGDSPT